MLPEIRVLPRGRDGQRSENRLMQRRKIRSRNKEPTLLEACCRNDQEAVRKLLERDADPNAKGKHDITPLIEAASRGNVPIVKELIKAGADVNAMTTSRETALAYASANDHSDVVRNLLKRGANPNCWI